MKVFDLVHDIKNSTKVKDVAKCLKNNIVIKAIGQSSVIKGATKVAAPLSVGLSYYGNFHDAKADNLTDSEAHARATVDTAVDTTVATAIQVGFTVAGTALIPIPGVGTAIGIAAGIGVNIGLNVKIGEKSVMDHIKGGVRKLTGWFK